MIKVLTVCGNGIGSSMLLKIKIEEIAKEAGLDVDAESIDSATAAGRKVDLIVTVKEFKGLFPEDQKTAVVRSYTNTNKIKEDVLPALLEIAEEKSK